MGGELWLFAGPNGSGKTTLAQRDEVQYLLSSVQRLNPDVLTKSRLNRLGYQGFADAPVDVQLTEFQRSADDVGAALEALVRVEARIAVETVLSTPKYRSLVEEVLALGGDVRMIYIILNAPELSIERVAGRVAQGGHDVPPDKIRDRWYRSLAQFPWFASRCRDLWVFDNSATPPAGDVRLVARGVDGRIVERNDPFPELAAALALVSPAIPPA